MTQQFATCSELAARLNADITEANLALEGQLSCADSLLLMRRMIGDTEAILVELCRLHDIYT